MFFQGECAAAPPGRPRTPRGPAHSNCWSQLTNTSQYWSRGVLRLAISTIYGQHWHASIHARHHSHHPIRLELFQSTGTLYIKKTNQRKPWRRRNNILELAICTRCLCGLLRAMWDTTREITNTDIGAWAVMTDKGAIVAAITSLPQVTGK